MKKIIKKLKVKIDYESKTIRYDSRVGFVTYCILAIPFAYISTLIGLLLVILGSLFKSLIVACVEFVEPFRDDDFLYSVKKLLSLPYILFRYKKVKKGDKK